VPVTIRLDPQRLGAKVLNAPSPEALEAARRKLIDALVSRGFRAQLRSGSLLTGALYVAFDAFPGAPPARVDWSQKPVELPTIPGELEAIEASIVNIVKKLEKVPVEAIGDFGLGMKVVPKTDGGAAPADAVKTSLPCADGFGEAAKAALNDPLTIIVLTPLTMVPASRWG
jgi:paraquat-inducible protein B